MKILIFSQFEILAACQWMDNVQIVVAQALAIQEASIDVKVPSFVYYC
jgi:hypothetical protein